MFKYLDKGISTPIALAIILLLAVSLGGITIWQFPEMQKEDVGNKFTEQSVEQQEQLVEDEEKEEIGEEAEVLDPEEDNPSKPEIITGEMEPTASEPTCAAGWKCKSSSRKAYQKESCSWEQETECLFGCDNGQCNPDPCSGIECSDYCSDGTRKYNGRCVGGECVYDSLACSYDCDGAICAGNPCTGVVCNDLCDGNARKYNGQCVDGICVYNEETCNYLCENTICIQDPCLGIECQNKCEGETRKYGGQCVQGICQYSSQICGFGCVSGDCNPDPCQGIECSDYCEGATRKYGGQCSDGDCSYSSQVCAFGCDNGQCNPDPCDGVTCDDYCNELYAYSDGYCQNGQCTYDTSELCIYGCDENVCLEYYCGWTWPQRVINKRTSEVLWQCPWEGNGLGPWCGAAELGSPVCCETSAHDSCADCTVGHCIAADCIGVSCSDTCDGDTRKYNGYCYAGECQYQTEECDYTCTNGQCTNKGVIFITSTFSKGDFGGLIGADAKCQSAADNAGLEGTWKAILSDSSINAKDRLPDTVFKRIDGAIIANSKADLFDGSISNPINRTETGAAAASKHVFTGSYSGGGKTDFHCDNWTNDTSNQSGYCGWSSGASGNWIYNSVHSCSFTRRIYCVAIE